MKKLISLLLCMVLLGTVAVAPVVAEGLIASDVTLQPIESGTVSPVAYTSDFDAYSNVVGVLNSDGTKTAYIFASAADAAQADSITGLISPAAEPGAELNTGSTSTVLPVQDATVYAGTPSVNYGTEELLYVGEHATRGYARTYMKFSLDALSGVSYKDVLAAYLCVRQTSTAREPYAVIEGHLAKSSWDESTITWNNRPDYYNEVMGRATIYSANSGTVEGNKIYLYITEAVMAWMQGMSNYGLMLKEYEDSKINAYHSSESDDYCPYLKIVYSSTASPSGQGVYGNDRKYYIVNRATGTCLTAASAEAGANVEQAWGSSDLTDLQKWEFTATEDGRYLITLGTTSLCLANTTSATGDVYIGDGEITNNNLWQIERNWNGTYRFYNDCSTYKYLNAGVFYEGTSANIYQYNYSCNFNFQDEWTLVPAYQGTAYFFMFTESATGDIDTTYGSTVVASQFNSYLKQMRTNKNASNGFSALQTGDVFYFSGHGLPNELYFNEPMTADGETVESSIVTAGGTENSLDSLSANALARQRLILLSSCYSGGMWGVDTDNMTGRLYQLGAHNVISYVKEITGSIEETYSPDRIWNSIFMTSVMNGRTLGEAKARVDRYMYEDYDRSAENQLTPFGNFYDRHDLGDDSYRPCYDMTTQTTTKGYAYRTNFEYTVTPVYGSGNTNVTLNGMSSIVIPKKYTLPSNHNNEQFDVYVDSQGAVYWYYTGTDVLHSFEPYTGNLQLGETVVSSTAALSAVNTFLQVAGYDVTGFDCEVSNEYSKNYTVRYSYYSPNSTQPDEQLIFHLQADANGNVYIMDFIADHYGEFSQEG